MDSCHHLRGYGVRQGPFRVKANQYLHHGCGFAQWRRQLLDHEFTELASRRTIGQNCVVLFCRGAEIAATVTNLGLRAVGLHAARGVEGGYVTLLAQ